MKEQNLDSHQPVNRRQLLKCAAGATALGALTLANARESHAERAAKGFKLKGRINHSIVHWCFQDHWNVEQTCKVANRLDCKSVELVGPGDWPILEKHNLACAIAGSHLFMQGMNNPKYQAGCIDMMKKSIDACADAGFKTVITFTGYGEETGPWASGANPDVSKLPKKRPIIEPDEGIKNCVAGYKKIVGYAEKKSVNLSLEMLNTRATDHPMKGHPGYQGDHIDYCMEIIHQVGSPNLGLLFDIYHVQIMDGDLIRRIDQCKDVINHVHTAGNPGRGELDQTQEINYRPVMEALIKIGFKGYVGHEFIPTRNPEQGLLEAVKWCDV
ncbi:MAG: TIM barrel protein [Planctomycetes bacterium]|nr:TIM barrel protein [Planctomycetota bacterium]